MLDQLEDSLSHGTVERRVETLRKITDLFLIRDIRDTLGHALATMSSRLNRPLCSCPRSRRPTNKSRAAGRCDAGRNTSRSTPGVIVVVLPRTRARYPSRT